jgi:hypothetical protein
MSLFSCCFGTSREDVNPYLPLNELTSNEKTEIIHLPNGDVFEGITVGGIPLRGKLKNSFEKYEGEFKDLKYHGKGTWTGSNGDVYVGNFENGKRHGHGTYTYSINETYTGEWVNGIREGQGEYVFNNGNKYIGSFLNDKRNGQGELKYANGSSYIGEFCTDSRQGLGVFLFADGTRHEGLYLKNKYHGYGVYTSARGHTYKGEFFDGQRDGNGVIYYADGFGHEGEFSNGLMHGKGVYKFPNGTVVPGTWHNDKCVYFTRRIKLSDNDLLIAEIRNMKSLSLKLWGPSSINKLNGEWESDVYPLNSRVNENKPLVNFEQIAIPSCEDTLENIGKIAGKKVKIHSRDIMVLDKTLRRSVDTFNNMARGTFIKRHKEAPELNPRSILGHRSLDSTLYAFILCKKKVPHETKPGVVIKAEKPLGSGSTKVAKIAYEWISGKPYVNLSLTINLSTDALEKLLKELKYCNLFAGRRGFSKTAPIAVHYYTKKKNDGSLEFKLGYFVSYYAGGDLHHFSRYSQNNLIPSKEVQKSCFIDIASALNALEEEKVVHGDISGTNFLVDIDDDGKVKGLALDDFGFSRAEDHFDRIIPGTYSFLPPESVFLLHTGNKDEIQKHPHATDVWGATLCYLELIAKGNSSLENVLGGYFISQETYCKNAFTKNETFEECCANISYRLNLVLVKFKKVIPTEEFSIIDGMLQIDPGKRLTGAQVLKALEQLEKRETSSME